MTLSHEYLDGWLETIARQSVRARTLQSFAEALRLDMRQNLGRLRLVSVTRWAMAASAGQQPGACLAAGDGRRRLAGHPRGHP